MSSTVETAVDFRPFHVEFPDDAVAEIGKALAALPYVTLCYRRPRRLPDWPYNLFCMIHGRDRDAVADQVRFIVEQCGLHDIEHDILFSKRCFKQRGASYGSRADAQRSLAANG